MICMQRKYWARLHSQVWRKNFWSTITSRKWQFLRLMWQLSWLTSECMSQLKRLNLQSHLALKSWSQRRRQWTRTCLASAMFPNHWVYPMKTPSLTINSIWKNNQEPKISSQAPFLAYRGWEQYKVSQLARQSSRKGEHLRQTPSDYGSNKLYAFNTQI